MTVKGDAPIPVALGLSIPRSLEIAGVYRHRTDQVLGIVDIVQRGVESRAEPLLGVQDQRICLFDALPYLTVD